MIFYKEENFFNYVFLFIAPASVSFVVGYPIFDELLFFIILLVLFIKNINKHKFSLNLKENKIYILLYTIFILYSIYGLLVLGNIKSLRYLLIFLGLIYFLIFVNYDKFKFEIKYIYSGFIIFLISYLLSGFIHNDYILGNNPSTVDAFLNNNKLSFDITNKFLGSYLYGFLGPGGINATEFTIYLLFIVSVIFYQLTKKKGFKEYILIFLLLSLSIFIILLEDSRNLFFIIIVTSLIFIMNSKKNLLFSIIIIMISFIIYGEIFKFRNIYTNQNFFITQIEKILFTSDSFDLGFLDHTGRSGTVISDDKGKEIITSKGDISRFMHLILPTYKRLVYLNNNDDNCPQFKNKYHTFFEIFFGVGTYGYWPKNIKIIDCHYDKNEIQITREFLKSSNNILEPPRVSTLAIFISEYGILLTAFIVLINIRKKIFQIVNNNEIIIFSVPFIIILFLGISTHFQDNILFWLILFNYNLLRKFIKEIV